MIELLIVLGAMVFFLVMQAFFSGSEMVMVSIEKTICATRLHLAHVVRNMRSQC